MTLDLPEPLEPMIASSRAFGFPGFSVRSVSAKVLVSLSMTQYYPDINTEVRLPIQVICIKCRVILNAQ